MVDVKVQEARDAWVARLETRRDALAAQHAASRLQYAELEQHIKDQQQALADLQRSIDVIHGGLQELDALLKD